MTIGSCFFYMCKENGAVNKVGKITVTDGLKHLERTLYFNTEDGKYYVIVNGEAHPVKPQLNSRGERVGRI